MLHRNAPLSVEGRHRLVQRFGEACLADRPSAPHRQPTATPAEVVVRIERLRLHRPEPRTASSPGVPVRTPGAASRKAGAIRKLIYGMNLTVDGYIAAAGDDIGRGRPSNELFQWWLGQELGIDLMLHGRTLWEAMSSQTSWRRGRFPAVWS